jgi:hypothetical protein
MLIRQAGDANDFIFGLVLNFRFYRAKGKETLKGARWPRCQCAQRAFAEAKQLNG